MKRWMQIGALLCLAGSVQASLAVAARAEGKAERDPAGGKSDGVDKGGDRPAGDRPGSDRAGKDSAGRDRAGGDRAAGDRAAGDRAGGKD